MRTRGAALALVITVVALLVPSATATVVLPGDTVFPALLTGSAGTLLASTSITFSTATYNATLVAAVFRITAATALCPAANCIDFYYQITNLATTTTGQIARLTDFDFTGFATDVYYRTDNAGNPALFSAGSKAPVTGDRDAPGDVVGFSFNPPDSNKILKGETSDIMVIRTNATAYKAGSTSVIDGGTRDLPTYAPTTVIPEPVTMLLMGGGLLALAAYRRWRP